MPRKPIDAQQDPVFHSESDISDAAEQGQQIKDNPSSLIPSPPPSLPNWGAPPTPDDRDMLLSSLMSMPAASQAAEGAARFGDPLGAVLAAFAGAAGGVARANPDMLAAQRAQMLREQQAAAFRNMPLGVVSPQLATEFGLDPKLSMAQIEPFMPLLQKHAELQQQLPNQYEVQAQQLIQKGQPVPPEVMAHVRRQFIPTTVLASTGQTQSVAQSLGQQLASGTLPPSMLPGFGKTKAQAIAEAQRIDPSYDPSKAELDYQVRLAGARLTGGGSAQMVARSANAAADQLNSLQQASDNFSRTNVQFANKPLLSIAKQSDPKAQAFVIAVQTARNEYAVALNRGNAPNREQLEEAAKAIPDTITPQQLPAAIAQMRIGLANTVRGQMAQAGYTGSAPAPTAPALATVSDQASYDALHRGAQYLAPDGSVRTKR